MTADAHLGLIVIVGMVIGFLGGLLGKGGSAIATPLLHALGVPAIIAVAAPLPATIPSTALASYVYWRQRLVSWRAVAWTITFGVPSTVLGALLTRWVGGDALVTVTDVVLVLLGARLVIRTGTHHSETTPTTAEPSVAILIVVACAVGLIAGLLANSGGFLLAPLFITLLHLPVKRALASSLMVSCVLAIPGTVVHAALGHIDWTIVGVFGAAAVPFSFVGARLAIRTDPRRLERGYGAVLCVLGASFLLVR